MKQLVARVSELLIKRGLTLAVVESATGGLISHSITNYTGCSAYYLGSVTAYSNEAKTNIIGVSKAVLESRGAVSEETARQMADGGRQLFGADLCIADTGIAGPGGATAEKPLGLFYLSLSVGGKTEVKRSIFSGDRRQIKNKAAKETLTLLLSHLQALK